MSDQCRYPRQPNGFCDQPEQWDGHVLKPLMGSLASHGYLPQESSCPDCGKSIFTPACGPAHQNLADRYDAEYPLPWCIELRGGQICGMPRPCRCQHDESLYYTPTANGGVIGKLSKHCVQQITVRGAGSYIEIKQGTDELLVSETQLQWVLDAITRAGKYLKWDERSIDVVRLPEVPK